LERGDYRELFDPATSQVMAQAAAVRGLEDEIGALRVALARLLAEERDPNKLALSLARIVAAPSPPKRPSACSPASSPTASPTPSPRSCSSSTRRAANHDA
jgi:hypothetical protein